MPVSYYYNVMHEAVIYAENQKKHCKFCLYDAMIRSTTKENNPSAHIRDRTLIRQELVGSLKYGFLHKKLLLKVTIKTYSHN